jgi:hypothetical protein
LQDSQQATAAAAPTEATTATAPAAAAAPKKTRKRGFSYARKKLVATKEVYLKPGCTYQSDQSLVSTITACPRKGKTTYTVAWNGQLPVGLHFDFLRTEFPKDTGPGTKGTNCAILKAACEAYEQQQPARQQQAPNSVAAATAAAAEAIGRSTMQSASESRSESRRSSTEPLSAAAAAAQLRVSPDTIPVNPPPEQPTTQRPSTRASVDGYVSEDSIVVDGNDVDESDNGYQSMAPLCDMWESDSGSEDSEAMPDRDATAPRNLADYNRTNWSHLASSFFAADAMVATTFDVSIDREDVEMFEKMRAYLRRSIVPPFVGKHAHPRRTQYQFYRSGTQHCFVVLKAYFAQFKRHM